MVEKGFLGSGVKIGQGLDNPISQELLGRFKPNLMCEVTQTFLLDTAQMSEIGFCLISSLYSIQIKKQ